MRGIADDLTDANDSTVSTTVEWSTRESGKTAQNRCI